jgi:hypothetical protein
VRTNTSVVSAASTSLAKCVIRCGAFTAKVNVSGASLAHPSMSLAVGMR